MSCCSSCPVTTDISICLDSEIFQFNSYDNIFGMDCPCEPCEREPGRLHVSGAILLHQRSHPECNPGQERQTLGRQVSISRESYTTSSLFITLLIDKRFLTKCFSWFLLSLFQSASQLGGNAKFQMRGLFSGEVQEPPFKNFLMSLKVIIRFSGMIHTTKKQHLWARVRSKYLL